MSAPHSMVVQKKEAKDYPFHFFPFFFEQEKKREKTTEITNFVSISLFFCLSLKKRHLEKKAEKW